MSKTSLLLIAALTLFLAACDSKKGGGHDHDHGEHGDHAHGNDDGKAAATHDTKKGGVKEGAHAGHDHAAHDHAAHDHAAHDHAAHDHGEPDPNAIPPDQSGEGLSKDQKFFVTFTPTANPIPFQKTFSLEVAVYEPRDHTKKVEAVSIDSVRAIMPAHKHGMKVEPKVTKVSPGTFKIEGMRFHMQGAGDDGKWVLELTLNDGKAVDLFTYDLQCCR